MVSFKSKSAAQTQQIASKLAQNFKTQGGVITLRGELGAGKTTFTQGFAKGLGIKDKIISPTFVLIRQHLIPNSARVLFHIDLYRLEDKTSLKHLGLEEVFDNPENIVLIEWPEKVKDLLPKKTVKIFLKKISLTERQITLD